LVKAGVHERLRLQNRHAAGAAGQMDERVGRRLLGDRGNDRDGERIFRPPGRLRFSGTTRKPQRAFSSAGSGNGVGGQGADSKRGS
jgi:hypothetical protein